MPVSFWLARREMFELKQLSWHIRIDRSAVGVSVGFDS